MSALALAVERYREALLLEKLADEAVAKTTAACRSARNQCRNAPPSSQSRFRPSERPFEPSRTFCL
jgi:hypothetical protein